MENANIKEKIDFLYKELRDTAATFIYQPDKIEKIKDCIFQLQTECNHKFENGKCIYCRKEQKNVD